MKAWLSLSFSTLVRAFSKRDRTSFSNCLPVRGLILFAAMQVAVVVATHAACVLPPAGLVSWWTGNGNAADAMGLNARSEERRVGKEARSGCGEHRDRRDG